MLGSVADSVASPAVEITLAVVLALYVRATPGVNAPKLAGAPSVSDSVAGTVPPTSPGKQNTRCAVSIIGSTDSESRSGAISPRYGWRSGTKTPPVRGSTLMPWSARRA